MPRRSLTIAPTRATFPDDMDWRTPLLSALLVVPATAELQRVPNTSLTLPPAPPLSGFSTTNAFPGLVFSQPVGIVSAPGETNRLFILEKTGRIQVITNLTNPTRATFLDLRSRVDIRSEGGVLGMAFHPSYRANGYLFVFYTSPTTHSGFTMEDRLARFQVDPADPNLALADSEVLLFAQRDQAGNHNGGDLHFGPDGYLYVALGDEGGGGDTFQNSQRIDRDFFSGLLRIDVDQRPGSLPPNPHADLGGHYAIPPDNPFVGVTSFNGQAVDPAKVRTEFWAVGLRNPWRFAFDPDTGRLYCGDVGQDRWEEINLIQRGGNYGWNYREGNHPFQGTPPPGVDLEPPIWEYPHPPGGVTTNQGTSVTGGIVYRGARLSQLYGDYLFADYGNGNIWALHHDGTGVSRFRHLTRGNGIVGFGADPSNGDVLFAEISTGQIRRLLYSETTSGDSFPPTLAATGAFTDLATLQVADGIVPYEINVPFWSDHAQKRRWFSVPDMQDRLDFRRTGPWSFPEGTVWIKHFEMELTNGVPASRRRLETRFLVREPNGVYGITYRWDESSSDAFLVPEEGLEETLLIQDGDILRSQVWRYPSRGECLRCHTPAAGYALGFNTVQLNRTTDYGSGSTDQLLALEQAGYFASPLTNRHTLRALVPAADTAASLEARARSYLHANCAQCHQPGGPALGHWDARVETPLSRAGLVHGELVYPDPNPGVAVVVPGSASASMLLQRITRLGPGRMPPLASTELDQEAIALLAAWIAAELPAYQTMSDWQTSHFGSPRDPDAASGADPDGDRAPNELEYLVGSDPRLPGDAWGLTARREADQIRLEFLQIANRGFEVEWTDALSSPPPWTALDVPANRPFFSVTNRPASMMDAAPGERSRFYRVRVYEP